MSSPNPNSKDLSHYFEYSSAGVEVLEDGLQELTFGEYLVERRVITRQDLFSALQLQDKHPGVRIGECIAALGILPYSTIESHLADWNGMSVVEA